MQAAIDMAMAGLDLGSAPPTLDYSRPREEWARFIAQCIHTRLDPDNFDEFVSVQSSRHPLPPAVVADVCLRPQPTNHESLDPRIPRYLQVLTRRKLIDTPSILKALYRYSTSHVQSHSAAGNAPQENAQHEVPQRWRNSYAAEETIFWRVSKAVRMVDGIMNASDAIETCKIVAKWMVLFTSASAAFAQDVMGQLQSSQSRLEMEATRGAFVMFLLGVYDNPIVLDALSRPFAKDARRALSESLASFVPSILQSSSPDVYGRLEHFRTKTLVSFEPADKKNEIINSAIDDIESSMALDSKVIPELPITNSRAGLYIYLNAAGDIQSTTIDLILASFDVLANAVFRNEGQKVGHLLRSYLINKLPLLLATLATSMFPPLTPQFCITEALSQVDTNAFPTLSAMFDDTHNSNTFTDGVRQDFCFACCLHGLIPESSIEGLLGEITYQTLPQGGRYVKEALVEQCMADPERIQNFVRELDNMDGNVGAVIGRLCNNKETMTLKLLCIQLAKKPLSLDVMLLFGKPTAVLQPLCELLDNWRYDEDQGEYQPVYEEFGAILLLLLAFVFRYNLTALDLGIRSSDSFVAKLLTQGKLSKAKDELTDQESGHLDGWIHGLFDSEAGGLGDELMSSCPPQDFHLLVATLFHNLVLAVGMNYLDEESLKTGIEYLVDTFLLPSLVMAISYMLDQLWIDKASDQVAVIKILQLILLTKQGSNEAQTMLSAVVNIVAKPLEHSLRLYQRQNPKSQDIEPLLSTIKDNVRLSRRTAGAGHNELEAWASTPNGGLAASVREKIQGFIQWSLHPGINIMPTSYTHRQILAALNKLGAKRLLHIILEEVKQQSDAAGSGSVAHDVATALICAPDVTNLPPSTTMGLLVDPNNPPVPSQTRMSLRSALKYEAEDFKSIQKSDPAMADMVIRLYRRVEAQLHMPQATETMLQGGLALGLDENAAALGDALAAAQNDGSMNLDLGGGGGGGGGNGMDLTAGGDSAGGLDFGADDDMFGNLGAGGGADLLEGWDDMDLS
ncbi:Uu.00g088830.m01.CDS01 [Anthostomella pinea]|uniref:Mediator of RNA polymerase II transcription subunit 5 n=1 Tax=Anthostomella pinea TaxID=933095 RepID=A0AAI8YK55_9PEZI|nr:Uu.00g088830.m01.CDS01 [Anthostomella pinea]